MQDKREDFEKHLQKRLEKDYKILYKASNLSRYI